MAPPPPKKKRNLWWDLVRLAVTLAALAYVISKITWQDQLTLPDRAVVWGWAEGLRGSNPVFVDSDGVEHPIPPEPEDPSVASPFVPGFITLLKGVNLWLFAAVVLAFPVSIALMALRWQVLLKTHRLDPGYLESLRLTWIGILMNNVLPSSIGGDLVKGVCIARRSPNRRIDAVMTVLIDRVLGLVSLMLVGAVSILSQRGRPELDGPSNWVLWILFTVLSGGIVFFSGRIRRLLRVAEIVARLPFSERIQQLDDSVFHYRSHTSALATCVGISLVTHGWVIGCVYFLGVALGLEIAPMNYYIFLPVIFTFGAVLPSIGGLGVLEGLFQRFFTLPGIGATNSSAVALCILYRIVMVLGSLPGAIPTYREFSSHGIPTMDDPEDSQAADL